MIIDNKDIIMFSLFVVIIILILMTNTKDHFALPLGEQGLSIQVSTDKETIKTISEFINNKISSDTFKMPNITVENLYLNKTMTLNGPSVIKNEIDFVTHNNNIILDVFPRYSIIVYHNENLPNRWVFCDGTIWWVHSTDITIPPVNKRPPFGDDYENYVEIITPDLRGRFIYGSNQTNFNTDGGMEKVTLKESQLPPHGHPSLLVYNSNSGIGPRKIVNNKWDNSPYANFLEINLFSSNSQKYALDTSKYGTFAYTDTFTDENGNKVVYEDALPHNNMPPYITSYYIMKL